MGNLDIGYIEMNWEVCMLEQQQECVCTCELKLAAIHTVTLHLLTLRRVTETPEEGEKRQAVNHDLGLRTN